MGVFLNVFFHIKEIAIGNIVQTVGLASASVLALALATKIQKEEPKCFSFSLSFSSQSFHFSLLWLAPKVPFFSTFHSPLSGLQSAVTTTPIWQMRNKVSKTHKDTNSWLKAEFILGL